ncbi:MAG: hypothetical protein ACFFAO_10600 [Candidatus Hermodarchaeota archaeon]
MSNIKKIEIRCPNCNKQGFIDLSMEKIPNISRGLLAINISSNTICPHSFIVYLDKNLHIRDYFIADFQIDLPDISIDTDEFESDKIPVKQIFDIDLIKLNLHAILITYILKAIFNNKKILLISDQKYLHNHIIHFCEYITKNSFKNTISILTEEDYKKVKKEYDDFIVLKGSNIIKNKKLIDVKKLKVEKQIVSRFFNETDLGYSYILLKNEVKKAYELSKGIIELIKNYKKTEKMGRKELIDLINKSYRTKISFQYLELLLDIIKNYFKFDISSISDFIFPALGM